MHQGHTLTHLMTAVHRQAQEGAWWQPPPPPADGGRLACWQCEPTVRAHLASPICDLFGGGASCGRTATTRLFEGRPQVPQVRGLLGSAHYFPSAGHHWEAVHELSERRAGEEITSMSEASAPPAGDGSFSIDSPAFARLVRASREAQVVMMHDAARHDTHSGA